MILETIRILADWLGRGDVHKDNGVNAALLNVDLDSGDGVPDPVQWIGDETRDNEVARKEQPPATPALMLTADAPFDIEGTAPTGQHRSTENVTIAVRYIRQDWNTADAIRDTHYTLRAIAKSLDDLFDNSNASTRIRNNVQIISTANMAQLLVRETVGESQMTGALLVTITARDTNP